jgi:hypothetical protein
VAYDLLFAISDLIERLNAPVDKIVDPGSSLGDRREQSVPVSWIKFVRCVQMDDALSSPGDGRTPVSLTTIAYPPGARSSSAEFQTGFLFSVYSAMVFSVSNFYSAMGTLSARSRA